jgi:hypothetical protein
VSLLIWTALAHASGTGRGFDLDGDIPGSNTLLLTGFGGEVKPRYIVSKSTSIYGNPRCIKGLVRPSLLRPALRRRSASVPAR